MVRILNNTKKGKMVDAIGSFYDLSACSQLCGNEIIIGLSKSLGAITYSDLRYTTFDKKDFRLYHEKEKLITGVVIELLGSFREIYVFNYGDKWIRNKKIAPSLNRILKENKISDDKNCVLQITEKAEIAALVKSVLRYNTFASFFSPEKGIVLTPTDHLDIFIASKGDNSQIVKTVVENRNEGGILYWRQRVIVASEKI